MSEAEHVLDRLQGWYAAQCGEDWEHEWGVKINTLDNPGWSIRIDPEETDLEGLGFPRQELERSKNDWVVARTSGNAFHASCGPATSPRALALRRSWAMQNAHERDAGKPRR